MIVFEPFFKTILTQTEKLKQSISFSQTIQQEGLCVFMLKSLRDEE